MKIEISKDGNLLLERAGEMRPQWCQFSPDSSHCGDHCPLFGEPSMWTIDGKEIAIHLCHGKRLICDKGDFTDRRGEK